MNEFRVLLEWWSTKISDEGVKLKNMYCEKPGKILTTSMPPFKVFINQ